MERKNKTESEVTGSDVNNTSSTKQSVWVTPTVLVMNISTLTAGFSPRFKDIPIPGLGAAS